MKIRNQPHHQNHLNHSSDCGFSLVELLVVVSIVAILSVSSVLGFGHLGQTLRVRESAGFLSDVVKQEELKVLRGDFDKVVIHFLADYLVIEEWATGAASILNLGSSCGVENLGYAIGYSISEAGTLTQKNGDGEVMQISSISSPYNPTCIEFKDSKDLEWNFQLSSGGKVSPTLRFAHFNLDRGNPQNSNHIVRNVNSKMEIVAPYGKKRFYDSANKEKSNHIIELRNDDLSIFETVSFQ